MSIKSALKGSLRDSAGDQLLEPLQMKGWGVRDVGHPGMRVEEQTHQASPYRFPARSRFWSGAGSLTQNVELGTHAGTWHCQILLHT